MRDLFSLRTLWNVEVTSRWNVAVSRLRPRGLRNSECHVCVRIARRWPSERDREAVEDLARTAPVPGRAVWRRTERDLQVMEEESVVFSNIEVKTKRAFRAWGYGGDGIYSAHTQRAVREKGRHICPPGKDRSKIHA